MEHVQELLTRISKYRFDGNNYVYDVILDKKEQKRIAIRPSANCHIWRRVTKDTARKHLDNARPFQRENTASGVRSNRTRPPYSRKETMALMELSASELSRERAIALTHLAGVEHLLLGELPNIAREPDAYSLRYAAASGRG